jgi:hypothetical protein
LSNQIIKKVTAIFSSFLFFLAAAFVGAVVSAAVAAVWCVQVSEECAKLESEASLLNDAMAESEEEEQAQITDRLTSIYERLEELDSATAEARASSILNGLVTDPTNDSSHTERESPHVRD